MLVEMANIVREPREVSIDRDQEGAVGFEVVLCTMVGEKKHSYSEWSLAVRPFSGSWLCTRVCVRVCTYKNCTHVSATRKGTKEVLPAKSGRKRRRNRALRRPPTSRIVIPSRVFSTLATFLQPSRDLTDPSHFAFMHACPETTRSSTS